MDTIINILHGLSTIAKELSGLWPYVFGAWGWFLHFRSRQNAKAIRQIHKQVPALMADAKPNAKQKGKR